MVIGEFSKYCHIFLSTQSNNFSLVYVQSVQTIYSPFKFPGHLSLEPNDTVLDPEWKNATMMILN